ncbi:MAG: hypothetical protein NTW74_20710 [Acidobacteria bacterium]|nr:hypothetical protein [Acidobacteriota bacterium]
MKRSLAASFFVTYIFVLGLWPTSRWWTQLNIMTWTMYARGIGDGTDHPLVEATFKDGSRLVLPTKQKRPFYYLYPPATQSATQSALFRFTEKPRVVDRLAAHICLALPDAKVIHYSETDAAERSFPCQH